jgi:hypothetical protein
MKRWNLHRKQTISVSLLLIMGFMTILPTNMMTANATSVGTVIENPVSVPEDGITKAPEPTIATPEPSITPTPEDTVAPTPEPTITPGADSTVTPTITPIVTPATEPTDVPTAAPTTTPIPVPTTIPFRSKTLELMSRYDYIGKSITGLSQEKVPVKTLQNKVKALGTLYGTGMPFDEYKKAMSYSWIDSTEYDKKPVKIAVDLTQTMNYSTYVGILKKLSRYDGVYLYKIGKSMEGRNLYSIEIDMKSDKKKKVIMLTGNIHAREFGGGTFIVKQFVDLVQKAQTDKKTMELLKSYKFVAVPIVNVDGREALIKEQSKWTSRRGELLKAFTNGTDGNRNFPGLQWGQVKKGNFLKSIIEKRPALANYPGDYAGSNKETKALMKFLYQYVVVEKAPIYLDMHQQGSIIYAGKGWSTQQDELRSTTLRANVLNVLNKGITRRKYNRASDGPDYGLKGEGSSLTDYAVTLAVGAKFSPAFGYAAFTDGKKEYMLMEIKDLDYKKIKVKAANSNFAALTVEIGYGTQYLGNSASTRRLLANEYNYYNYGKLLEALPGMIK